MSSLYTLLQDSSDKELEFLTLVEESLRASQEDIIIPVGTMKTHIGELAVADEPLIETVLQISRDDKLVAADSINCLFSFCDHGRFLINMAGKLIQAKHKAI